MLFKGFSRTILVIGDNLMARKTVSRNLAYYEYEVLEGSTVDGIELFREKPYDIGLVILDTTAEDPSGRRYAGPTAGDQSGRTGCPLCRSERDRAKRGR